MLTRSECPNAVDAYLDETDGFMEGMRSRPRWTTLAGFGLAFASAAILTVASAILMGGLVVSAGRSILGVA